MSVNDKFVVVTLYLKYIVPKHQRFSDAYSSLAEALHALFGSGYNTSLEPATITVPKGSNFVEIDEALAQEFKKYPALKGMKFQLQMCKDTFAVL